MIPKIIHYCWFGKKELPSEYKKYIDSWKKNCPDYQIKKWNEDNFDINSSTYMREAYEENKWAFVSDYARLKIIYDEGGIYLDTDVELIKPLDDLLEEKCFLATETTGYINTGLGFGAEKGNEIIKEMLDEYSGLHFKGGNGVYDNIACPKRNTAPFTKYGFEFSLDKRIRIKNALILPPEYFCPIDYMTGETIITNKTYSIHHYSATWLSNEDLIINEKIDEIVRKSGFLSGQIKKQWFLYNVQKKAGKTNSFIKFLASKIKLKLRISRWKV